MYSFPHHWPLCAAPSEAEGARENPPIQNALRNSVPVSNFARDRAHNQPKPVDGDEQSEKQETQSEGTSFETLSIRTLSDLFLPVMGQRWSKGSDHARCALLGPLTP